MSTRTGIFIAVIVLLLLIGFLASRSASGKEGFLVGKGVHPVVNGLAMVGEFASVATFLGLVGSVSLMGLNGFLVVLSVPLGFLVLLIVVSGPLRRNGKFTVSDMVAARFPSRSLRSAIGVTGLILSAVYMLGQFVGAAGLVSAFFGVGYGASLLIIGGCTLILVLLGGMPSATAVQVAKTVLLLAASVALFLLVLSKTNWNPLDLMTQVGDTYGTDALRPAHAQPTAQFDTFSASIATVFGLAGMPHLMIRLLTVRTEVAARRSSLTAVCVMSFYLVLMTIVGYGASVIVGRATISSANPGGTAATIQLADELGGEIFASILAGLVFAIIAAVLSGLVVTMMGTIAHDFYAEIFKSKRASVGRQVGAARISAVVICLLAGLAALGMRNANLIFIGSFSFGVAGSTILPVVLLGLYWRRFNLTGALAAVTVGLASSATLLILSPTVMGQDAIFPYTQPAAFTIPLAFLAAWAGSTIKSRSNTEPAATAAVAKESMS